MALKFKTGASLNSPNSSFSFASSRLFQGPSLSHLYFSSRKHIFLFFQHLFRAKACLFFWQVAGGMWQHLKKKASSPLGQMLGAFEQYRWSNLPWGFGHWRTPDESEQETKERKGNTGEKKCATICQSNEKGLWVSGEKSGFISTALLKWDFVCSWWSAIL